MSIFHFCRKLQGPSCGDWKGPKITPTGTHWNSDDSTTALSSVRPPSSRFSRPATLGIAGSWACESFINQLFRWAGFDLCSYNWEHPQCLTSTTTDTTQGTRTACNTYLNISDTEATTRPPSNEAQHTTCRPATCFTLVRHKTCTRKSAYQRFVEDSIFSAENPKATKMYLLFFELQPESHKTSAQSPGTRKFQKDNWSPDSTEKLSSSCAEGFGSASRRKGDR